MLLVPVKEVSVLTLFSFNAVSSLFRLQRYSKKRNNANIWHLYLVKTSIIHPKIINFDGYIQLDLTILFRKMACWQLLFPSASDRWFPYMGGESIAK